MRVFKALLVVPLAGAILSLSACDPRTPKEKVSDGASKVSEGKISEGLDDVGEGVEDAVKQD